MKVKRKTNRLEDEANKIEGIPEEVKNGEDDVQEKPSAANKPKKKRFLARLRRAWTWITGCMRCCTSIQDEESHKGLPEPSGINMVDSKADSSTGKEKEDDKGESIIINTTNERSEESSSNSPSLEEIPEELNKSDNTSPSGSNDYTSDFCSLEEEISEELNESSKNIQSGTKDDTSDSWSLEEEIPQELFKLRKTSQRLKELLESTRPSQSGCNDDMSDSWSLEEEIPQELFKLRKTSQRLKELLKSTKPSQSGSNDDISDSWSLEEKMPQQLFKFSRTSQRLKELLKSTKPSQSGRRDDASDSCSLEEEIPKELNKSSKTSQSGTKDDTSDSWHLGEEIPQELFKFSKTSQRLKELFKPRKTSQSGRRDDDSDSCSLEEKIPQELFKFSKTSQRLKELFKPRKTSQSGRRDDTSGSCSLEEVTPQELFKSSTTSESSTNPNEEPTTSEVCLEKANQAAKETSGTVPLTLNSLTFHQELGTGSYGKVYLARDVIRKECVAIKVSPKQKVMRESRFAERHVLQLSNESPYLIHGLAAFHTQTLVYYVMELANGGDLSNFIIMTFPLDTATIQFIIAEIICGTQFLHKNGIIHRDLKPGNILLTVDGHIKITDFGLAITDVYEKTNEFRRGTPGYAAPEQLEGVDYGPGVDYFAIGVILYKLYNFKAPFKGQDGRDIDLAVVFLAPRYRKSLTQDTVNILKGLLEKDQFKRLGVNGDIKNHQYFKDINWEDVEARRVPPPPIMTATSIDLNVNDTLSYAEEPNNTKAEHQKIFNKFSFVCAEWSQHYHPVETEY